MTARAGAVGVSDATIRGYGAIDAVRLPMGPRGLDAVAELDFSRRGIERATDAANRQLYLSTGIAALIIYLLILPLLFRLARTVRPMDPRLRTAAAALRRGLAQHELVVHYQPKISLRTGKVAGVEALVRWNHPKRGILSPAEFLPTAEAVPSLLKELTIQVLDQAMADCIRWGEAGNDVPIAVNMAMGMLSECAVVGLVGDALQRHDLQPGRLTLELTESALMEQGNAGLEALLELRRLGVSLSIDDFGTGHSSLARLRLLPVDELKIDRSFIGSISRDVCDRGIAQHIIELGLHLGLRVVAEGVEDEATLEMLRAMRCTVAQGFYISKPIPEHEFSRWLGAAQPEAALSAAATPVDLANQP